MLQADEIWEAMQDSTRSNAAREWGTADHQRTALLTGVGVISPSVGIGYNPNRRIDVARRAALIHDNVPSGSKRRFNFDVGSTVVAAMIYEFVSASIILIVQRIQKEDVCWSAKTNVNKLQRARRYHVVQKLHICPV